MIYVSRQFLLALYIILHVLQGGWTYSVLRLVTEGVVIMKECGVSIGSESYLLRVEAAHAAPGSLALDRRPAGRAARSREHRLVLVAE